MMAQRVANPGIRRPMHEPKPTPPILANKHYASPSAFMPESLLREARRQRGLAQATVPAVCALDPTSS